MPKAHTVVQGEADKRKREQLQAEVSRQTRRADTLMELGWKVGAWEYAAQLVARERNGPTLQITIPQPESTEVSLQLPLLSERSHRGTYSEL